MACGLVDARAIRDGGHLQRHPDRLQPALAAEVVVQLSCVVEQRAASSLPAVERRTAEDSRQRRFGHSVGSRSSSAAQLDDASGVFTV